MFSVVFPGQGSQKIGMAKEFFDKYEIVKKIFKDADNILEFPISKVIFEGPEENLNLTENTQPAIFLTSYAIFNVAQKEFGFNFDKTQFIAGHSLGEYSALCCFGALSFEETIKILKKRGKSMQDAVPAKEGGMLAVLGSNIKVIEEIINKLLGNLTSIIRDSNKLRINYKQKKHDLIKFISENPNQLQRPIFFNGKNYIICRPPEKVLEFL